MRQLLMPKLGLTMTEGSVVEWPIPVGERFEQGATYVVVDTDKVSNDVEAPAAGRLTRIIVPEGETVAVGTVLAEWEAEAGEDEVGETGAGTASVPTTGSAPGAPGAASASAAAVPVAAGQRKATPVEAATARRLTEAKQTIPHFYLSAEIEVSRLQALRRQWNETAGRPRLTVTHLLVAAAGRAIARHPDLNRVWTGDGFAQLDSADVGIAVDAPEGLLAPVLRRADVPLTELVARIDALVGRARAGTLGPDDVGGGLLTVSNAGMHDVTWMASIINPGQSAILGVGSQRDVFRPDASGAPRLSREIGVVLSCDHRAFGGVQGLRLLNEIRGLLHDPQPLFN